MRITRNHNDWRLAFTNTLAQRTVLAFAGFSLFNGKKYKPIYVNKVLHNREAINWLVVQWKQIRRIIQHFSELL